MTTLGWKIRTGCTVTNEKQDQLTLNSALAKQTGDAVVWRSVDLVAVKAIFLFRLLILARLLTPDDFGLLAIGVTIIGVLLALSDFGMVPALVQRAEVSERDFNVAWTIGLARAVSVVVGVLIAAPWIATLFGDARAVDIVRVLTLGVLVDALASIKIAHLNRRMDFRSLAVLRVAQATINAVVAIALAPAFGVWALVGGALAGSMIYTTISYIVAPHRPRLQWEKSSGRELMRYGRWVFFTGVIVIIGAAVMRAVISRRLGVAELGMFFLAARLAFLPDETIESIIGSVAFPLYARLQGNVSEARATFRTAFVGTATLLIPANLLLVALAPGLVEHILGDRWEGTASVIQILAMTSLVGLIGTVSVPLLKGFGLPSRITVLEVVQSALCISLVWWLAGEFGLGGAAMAMFAAAAGSQILSIKFVRQILIRPYAGLARILVALTMSSLLGTVAAFWLDNVLPGFIGFAAAAASGTLVTLGLIYIADRYLNLGLGRALVRPFPAVARFFRMDRG